MKQIHHIVIAKHSRVKHGSFVDGYPVIGRKVRPSFVAEIELSIDLDEIARVLGEKAVTNTSKKTHMKGGLITAKVLNDVPPFIVTKIEDE